MGSNKESRRIIADLRTAERGSNVIASSLIFGTGEWYECHIGRSTGEVIHESDDIVVRSESRI